MKKTRIKRIFPILMFISIIALVVSCSPDVETNNNETENALFSLKYLKYDEADKYSSTFGNHSASDGAIIKEIVLNVTNRTNSVQYIGDYGTTSISIVLSNGHRYSGTAAEFYKFFPEQTKEITVFFEVIDGESINGVRVN